MAAANVKHPASLPAKPLAQLQTRSAKERKKKSEKQGWKSGLAFFFVFEPGNKSLKMKGKKHGT